MTWHAHRTQEGHIHLWGIILSILVSLCFDDFSSFIRPQLQSVLFWHLEATFEKFLWFKPFLALFLCPTISPCHSFLQDSALEDSVLNSENLKEINYLMSFSFHMGTASLSWILYIVKQYNDKSKWKKIHPQFHPLTCQLFSVLLSLLGFPICYMFSRVVTTITSTSTTQLSAFISNIILVCPIVTWILDHHI